MTSQRLVILNRRAGTYKDTKTERIGMTLLLQDSGLSISYGIRLQFRVLWQILKDNSTSKNILGGHGKK
jgi:hypothetical protein